MANKFSYKTPHTVMNGYTSAFGPFGPFPEVSNNAVWVVGFERSRLYPKPYRTDTPGEIHRVSYNTATYDYKTTRAGAWYAFYGSASYIGDQMFIGTGDGTSSETSSSRADAVDAAITAYAKLGQGRFNAATFLGELKPTVHMVKKRALQLQSAMKNLQNGSWKAFGEVLPNTKPPSRRQRAHAREHWGDVWLEYTYGWAPLVSDVYGAMSSLQKGITGNGSIVKSYSGKGGAVTRRGANADSAESIGGSLAKSASFQGTVSNQNARALQEYGLLNPAALAWELLPYSFVADWFLPIGNILAALTSGTGLSGISGSAVWEDRQVTSGKRSGLWRFTEQQIYRRPIDPFWLIANAILVTDGLSDSWRRMVSAIALLEQRARAPVRRR